MRTEARFGGVGLRAGHYESFYVKAARPEGGLGVWIRHTVHKRRHAEPTASIWFTLFDAEAEGPIAAKATFPADRLSSGDGAYIRIGGAVLEPGRLRGSVESGDVRADWDLEFDDDGEPFRHLPYGWLYRGPLPRTKLLSPHPNATYGGRITAGDREIDVDGWPGMVGHNWGAEHAERWTWIEGARLDGEADSYFDTGAGRIRVARRTTPWIANGVLSLGGERTRLGGLDKVRSTVIEESPTGCRFTLPGKDVMVRGEIGAPPERFVAWLYSDPDGGEHNTVNCSISDLELTVERAGRPPRRLRAAGTAAYELGMRETDHGIPVQPFPDG